MTLRKIITTMVLLTGLSASLSAQVNPPNPPEPQMRYQVTVSAMPSGVAYTSGGGSYLEGTEVWIRTSGSDVNYVFDYWEKDGEVYSHDQSFQYKVDGDRISFVAHYKVAPINPPEPVQILLRRLYVKSDPEGESTFNITSGTKYNVGSQTYVYAYGSTGYRFVGWYDGDEKVSDSQGLTYIIPDRDATLVARFTLDPSSPADPSTYYSETCEVNVTTNEPSRGTVTSSGMTDGRAKYGTTVTLTATPAIGFKFAAWMAGDSILSRQTTYAFVVDKSKSEVDIQAVFMIDPRQLTYEVDGMTYRTFVVEGGSPIDPLPAPTIDGREFGGWQDVPATMPSADLTIRGGFVYTIVYNVDGIEYLTEQHPYGETITTPTSPTKEGYTFSGWSELPVTMPANDVDVVGTFTVNQYKVSYMVDGEEYKTYTLNYGDSLTEEPAPQKEGYTFSGWSEAPAVVPSHDVVIEGMFTVNTYNVNYYVDDSLYTTIAANYGTELTLIDTPTKEGYSFSGWSEPPVTMPANDVDIVGTFTVNQYAVTYMLDDNEYKTYTLNYGDSITAEPAPQKEGHTFSGWSEAPAVVPAHDVVIEGTFTVNTYNVNYYVDDSLYTTIPTNYGTELALIDAPTKEGYTFFGWIEVPCHHARQRC